MCLAIGGRAEIWARWSPRRHAARRRSANQVSSPEGRDDGGGACPGRRLLGLFRAASPPGSGPMPGNGVRPTKPRTGVRLRRSSFAKVAEKKPRRTAIGALNPAGAVQQRGLSPAARGESWTSPRGSRNPNTLPMCCPTGDGPRGGDRASLRCRKRIPEPLSPRAARSAPSKISGPRVLHEVDPWVEWPAEVAARRQHAPRHAARQGPTSFAARLVPRTSTLVELGHDCFVQPARPPCTTTNLRLCEPGRCRADLFHRPFAVPPCVTARRPVTGPAVLSNSHPDRP